MKLMKKQKIVIIGGGRIGQAMQFILKKYEPVIWDIDPAKTHVTDSCDLVLKNADIIFICAPAMAHLEIAMQIKQCAPKNAIVVSLAKGLGAKGETVPEMLSTHLSVPRIAMLCGPMMAEEILKGLPSAALLASKKSEVCVSVSKLFTKTSLLVTVTNDVSGTAWLSVLKNIYATVWGAFDALGGGSNEKGILISRIAEETEALLPALHGKSTSFSSVAGIGDLWCTLTSEHSRNRSFGASLVTGVPAPEGEGAKAIMQLKKRLGKKYKNFQVLKWCEMLVNKIPPKKVYDAFLASKKR